MLRRKANFIEVRFGSKRKKFHKMEDAKKFIFELQAIKIIKHMGAWESIERFEVGDHIYLKLYFKNYTRTYEYILKQY